MGPILFALAWFVLGFLSPGYSIWGTWIAPYEPISGLGMGSTALFMNTAFVLSGLLIVVDVVGIFQGIRGMSAVARLSCTLLLALSGLGSILCGLFTLESFFPHFVGFLLAVGTPVLSFLVTGLVLRGAPRWRRFGSWLLFATFDQAAAGAGLGVSGLTQRILAIEVHAAEVVIKCG